ncbi:MAG: hypothetical protein LC733_10070 [Actinobacteria bacterium]|nr:hypothetical protein [Actinomycetota bacterium]
MRSGARGGEIAPAVGAGALLAVATVFGSAALACTNLATIGLSSEAGRPGDTIVLTGTSFPVPRAREATPTPVVVRWRGPDGPVLVATQRRPVPDPKAPDAPPTIFTDEYGTPARATLRVLAPGEQAGTLVAPPDFVATGDSGSTAMIVMTLLFGAVALSLFGGGVIAFVNQLRRGQAVPESRTLR